eukprot:gnl/TRDRNA2_/TRDRNA2_169802_c1_seq1.p1 gnl/TRDRNA2_/TRDRNA2_169802_c1~~gnl/TRDRNA2_/TRDRNA2_169802_c1_seq1.p1  ORF type:complete len:455 (-),score=77.02 gnl/TRDRNA2_/TRDRNA2_169802_c1_seq1:284-1648(-)
MSLVAQLLSGDIEFLIRIPSYGDGVQQPRFELQTEDLEAGVRKLREDAEKLQSVLQHHCQSIVDRLNAAENLEDLELDSPSLEKAAGANSSQTPRSETRLSPRIRSMRAWVQATEIKSLEACMQKVRNDHAKLVEPVRSLLDVASTRIVAADAYDLALVYAMTCASMNVQRVENAFLTHFPRNSFEAEKPVSNTWYRDLTMNVLLKHEKVEQVVEIRLLLEPLQELSRFMCHPVAANGSTGQAKHGNTQVNPSRRENTLPSQIPAIGKKAPEQWSNPSTSQPETMGVVQETAAVLQTMRSDTSSGPNGQKPIEQKPERKHPNGSLPVQDHSRESHQALGGVGTPKPDGSSYTDLGSNHRMQDGGALPLRVANVAITARGGKELAEIDSTCTSATGGADMPAVVVVPVDHLQKKPVAHDVIIFPDQANEENDDKYQPNCVPWSCQGLICSSKTSL